MSRLMYLTKAATYPFTVHQVFLTKGYGVRDLDTLEPVTEQTLFLLASVTKALSGVSMATVLRDQDRDQ